MKKILILLLAAMMIFSCVSAYAEYEKPVFFTVCTTKTESAGDYNSDGLAQYFKEKFNIDYEVWPIAADSHDEKVRVWVNSESMPTMATWGTWNYSEYLDYVDQGLIAGLPAGWEEKYPNLLHMIEMTGLKDALTVDGTIYAIPNAVFGVFLNMDHITGHQTTYYRKDWAKELGYDFGDTTTFSEFKKFLKDCIDKDMGGNGTYGLVAATDWVNTFFFDSVGIDYDGWMKTDNGMVWAPTMDGYKDILAMMREWYQEGLIYPDYYNVATGEVMDYIATGKCAACRDSGPVSHHVNLVNAYKKNGVDPEAAYGYTLITGDDGVAHSMETTNFWTILLFNPETDAETLDRCLALIDFLCSKEGIITCQMGVPGVEWEYDADGKPVYLDAAKNADGSVIGPYDRNPSYRIWRQLGMLSDDFNFVSPAYPTWIQESTLHAYEVKSKAEVVPYNYDYFLYSSETKNIFSVDIQGAVTAIAIGNEDIGTAWDKFIEDNAGMWKPLETELNEAYGK